MKVINYWNKLLEYIFKSLSKVVIGNIKCKSIITKASDGPFQTLLT